MLHRTLKASFSQIADDLRFRFHLKGLNDHASRLSLPLSYHRRGKERRKVLEPATWIEQATCDLRISESPTVTSQGTTKPDAPDMGLDGAELSCPGSSVVAED